MTVCDRTGLSKPECHCPTCTAALIASHAPAVRGGGGDDGATRGAAVPPVTAERAPSREVAA
jgi:hypothetical protein